MSATPSRRDVLMGAAGAAAGVILPGTHVEPAPSFLNIVRPPDFVRVLASGNKVLSLEKAGDGRWTGPDVEIVGTTNSDHLAVAYRGKGAIRIQLRWRGDLRHIKRYLGDHWERSYADLEWRGEVPNRPMPWYFMAFDGRLTNGYGVRTRPGAMCFWNADAQGISLWADVRSGGVPVELGDRTLAVCEVVCRAGRDGESPFRAAQEFCRQMCPSPRLPSTPVYGTNDWNFAYGNNNAELIATVASMVSELSPNTSNRPYSVIDDGWEDNNWNGKPTFGDMAAFASRLKSLGVRPGLWFRPLIQFPGASSLWKLSRNPEILDPTVPEVQAHVTESFRKFVGWGYEMVKHDYSTYDIFGQWGFQMGSSPTHDGWAFHDRSKTSAEVISELYRLIREAAGSARLIGCNTVGHLAAGTHELMRIGDDTSGRSWDRNRRMGVNTLAFRAAQHGTFYEADPDIVAITTSLPWELNEQWLRLVSESGLALFVAPDPKAVEAKHKPALRQALAIAAERQPIGEPLDWLETDCPRRWRLRGRETEFAWMGPEGSWPFGD